MENAYFLAQVKHNKITNAWDKGVVIKADAGADNRAAALQSYHAYLGAYAYGHDENTDYVYCQIIDGSNGTTLIKERWPIN